MTKSIEKKVCVPIVERKPNKVDELQDWIKRIQKDCKHDFRLVKEPKLIESLVSGVFVGPVRGPIKMFSSETRMKLVCINCSKEKSASIVVICPKCLSPMREGRVLGYDSRKYYFGEEYLYFSILLQRCSKCSFTLASDEWDQ